MSFRAIVIGVLLGLAVAASTYFNDWVIRQTQLIGNHLPISVFGVLVILILVGGPLLRVFGEKAPLRAGELAIITAIALAACGWPGSGFFRTFTTSVAMPTHLSRTQTAWQTTGVMSFVPGGSPRIAPGQIVDWPKLLEHLQAASRAPAETLAGRLWACLPPQTQRQLQDSSADDLDTPVEQTPFLDVLNDLIVTRSALYDPQAIPLWQSIPESQLPSEALPPLRQRDQCLARIGVLTDRIPKTEDPDLRESVAQTRRTLDFLKNQVEYLSHRANRSILVAFADGAIAPAPRGSGLLLADGRDVPFVTDTLVQGWSGSSPLSADELPWEAWWPTLRLWGGLALLLGLASLCLAMIVHHQWANRELLAYPIVSFVSEVTTSSSNGWMPDIARSRPFWVGFGLVFAIHTMNGISEWYPAFPRIALSLDFSQLQVLFPNAAKVAESHGLFTPRLYLSVVAFAFFLSNQVSLSLGVSTIVWIFFGSLLIRNGLAVENNMDEASMGAMIRFGAFAGSAIMIFYVGRRYYLNVAGSALGLPRAAETPAYVPWAARGFVLCCGAAVLILSLWAGMDWRIGVLTVGCLMLLMLVISRINVETGAFFLQAGWLPIAVLAGLLGMNGLSPQVFIVVAMLSVVLVIDPRELITPFLLNGLKMSEQVGQVRPPQIAKVLAFMLVLSFLTALLVTLTLQYNLSAGSGDTWAREMVPTMPLKLTSNAISQLSSRGELADSVTVSRWQHFTHAKFDHAAVSWMALGLLLVITCATARLRLPWWPLHPVIFLVWGTYPMALTSFSFLLGWAIKASLMRFAGARLLRMTLPLFVGVIAGEMLAAIGWTVIGAGFYFNTHTTPITYNILPG